MGNKRIGRRGTVSVCVRLKNRIAEGKEVSVIVPDRRMTEVKIQSKKLNPWSLKAIGKRYEK